MAFAPEQQIQRIPTTIRTVKVDLFNGLYDDDSPYGKKYARFELRVDDQYGQPMNWRSGDLTNHLDGSPITIQQLIEWIDWLKTKAEDEILP